MRLRLPGGRLERQVVRHARPGDGPGLTVKRGQSPLKAALWVDNDGVSDSASSALLLKPEKGFTGNVVELLCFYESSTWTLSLKLPQGC